jgi:HAE1 family hydrophobic/amphiphilic exporter-1
MAPLVLFTGPGSEIYRGLGSVVVGGLAVSTVFTLLLVPAVFSLAMDARDWARTRFSGKPEAGFEATQAKPRETG